MCCNTGLFDTSCERAFDGGLPQRGNVSQHHSGPVVHGWGSWGVAYVEQFLGMSAFALWGRKLQTLSLAGDRLGGKSMDYTLLARSCSATSVPRATATAWRPAWKCESH